MEGTQDVEVIIDTVVNTMSENSVMFIYALIVFFI